MAKEALFNILNNHYYFGDIQVLDLFAGTGNIGYEFASRGTKHIIAVDANPHCIRFIQKTAQELDLPITPIKADVAKYLEKSRDKVDIVFADPPYDLPPQDFETLVHLVFKNELLTESGLLVIEHSKHTNLSNLKRFSEKRKYGGSAFSFFKN